MSRPLRLERAGTVYHVTSRGDRQQAIYQDDTDRLVWMGMLANTCARFNFVIHSFCLMTNHYHLVIETGEANLSSGMRQLNGTYAQYFNRRHELVGHLFQGRYKAILVQKESHLLEVARYVVLNPIRAGMVSGLDDWQWSSFHYFMQSTSMPSWLCADWILALFGVDRLAAIEAYRRFVADGVGQGSPFKHVRHQLMLGDDVFVTRLRDEQIRDNLNEVTREHRRAVALSLAEYQAKYADRDQAITAAYYSTAYTMAQIAQHFKISYRTVSRVVRKVDTAGLVYDWQN